MSTTKQITQSFQAGTSPQLFISNVRGSVIVRGEERDDIQVTAVKHTEGIANPERTEILMQQEGDRVTVKTQRPSDDDGKRRWRGEQICPVDYTVRMPNHCDVDINQVKGAVQVSDVTGAVKVNAVQGVVTLDEIDGSTQVHLVNAELQGHGWSGRADVKTVSGHVEIDAARLTRLEANTVSGDLVLKVDSALEGNGRYDFNSVSGHVTLYLPKDQGLETRGSTFSGRLKCDLPHEFTTRRKFGGWRATINQGGPPVRFNSISGNLRLLEGN